MTDAWQSNTTLDTIADWLRTRTNVAVLTHVKPDGDAVGSSLAACRAIRMADIRAECWYTGPMPTFFDQLAEPGEWRRLGEADMPEHEYDGVLIVDTGSWGQLEAVQPWLASRAGIAAVVDHHRQGDPDVAHLRVTDVDAASASMIVGELARLLLGTGAISELPLGICEPLLVGLASDTGWFRHSNTDARALSFAASLVEAGVEYARLFALIEQRDRPGRLRLMGRALCSMELFHDDRVALMTVRQADFEAAGATQGDSGGFSDLPLAIAGVMVGVTITESYDEKGQIAKISMRSKQVDGAVDVNAVARTLGGGGHARAAGARMRCTLDEARVRVLDALG